MTPQPSRFAKRAIPLFFLLLALALLAVGGWFLWQNQQQRSAIARSLPAETIALATVSLGERNPASRAFWSGLGTDSAYIPQPLLTKAQQFLGNPLIDEAALRAVATKHMGLAFISTSSEQPIPVLVLATTKPQALRDRVAELFGQTAQDTEQYRDHTVLHFTTQPDLYVTDLTDAVAITTDHASIFALLDVSEKEHSALADQENWKMAQAKDIASTPVRFYIDGSTSFTTLVDILHIPVPRRLENPLGGDLFMGGLYAQDGQLAVRGFWHHADGWRNSDATASAVAHVIPETATTIFSGHHFAQSVKSGLSALSESDPLTSYYVQTLQSYLQDNYRFSLDRDLLDLLTQDFIVFSDSRPLRLKTTGERKSNVSIAIQLKDRESFVLGLPLFEAALAGGLAQQYKVPTQPQFTMIRNDATVRWTALDHPRLPIAIHLAVIGDVFVVSADANVIRSAVTAATESTTGPLGRQYAQQEHSFLAAADLTAVTSPAQFASIRSFVAQYYRFVALAVDAPQGDWRPITIELRK